MSIGIKKLSYGGMIIKVYLRNLLQGLARWEGSPIAQSLLPLEGSSLAPSWLLLVGQVYHQVVVETLRAPFWL